MSSVLIQVADALVDTLNAMTWSGTTYEAQLSFAAAYDEELSGGDEEAIQIDVIVPEEFDDVSLDTRGTIKRVATFDIVIRRKFRQQDNDAASGAIDPDQIKELIELGEKLSKAATFARMTDAADAAWTDSDHNPIYRRDHLRQLRQFTGVVAITFEIESDL